jgi:cobalt/nickel transport system permease protein
MENAVFSEKYASAPGFLQRINPPVKIITLLGLLISVNIFQTLIPILLVYCLVLFFAFISKIPLGFFFKRVWLFIPLFSGIIVFPAMFNIFTPGTAIFTFIRYNQPINLWGNEFQELSITQSGLMTAGFFILRVATSISLTILLTLTTHWAELLKGLRILGIPNMFILVLSMTYQYIFLLVRLVQDMYLAKKSRTIQYVRNTKNVKGEQKWVASRIGTILRKSFAIIDEIQLAMIARGFHGEVKLLNSLEVKRIDILWLFFVIYSEKLFEE